MWVFIGVGFNGVGTFPFDMLFGSMNGTYRGEATKAQGVSIDIPTFWRKKITLELLEKMLTFIYII